MCYNNRVIAEMYLRQNLVGYENVGNSATGGKVRCSDK